MKFSIVTISFNQGKYLEETINSVLNQSGVEVEYIVVDPGSTDNSRSIIEKYKDRITHVILEKDNGPGDGLNKGFAKTTGDIFGFINADDILLPGTLKKVANIFIKNKADVVSAHGYVIDEFSIVRHKIFSNKLKNTKYTLINYCCGNTSIVQPSTFFTKKIYKKTNGFDNTGKVVWDASLFIDFIKADAKFMVVNDIWSGFRVYPQSLTGKGLFYSDDVFRQMQLYAGLKPVSKNKKFFLKILKWLNEPHVLLQRISDGFRNPKRLL